MNLFNYAASFVMGLAMCIAIPVLLLCFCIGWPIYRIYEMGDNYRKGSQ